MNTISLIMKYNQSINDIEIKIMCNCYNKNWLDLTDI